jgi:very-short-patch-repair endonuclease
VKFRRQAPIGPYIVDFVSYEPRIVIELDGSQHAERAHSRRDAVRDRWLRTRGFVILRFWDPDVLTNPEAVLSAIHAALERHRGR